MSETEAAEAQPEAAPRPWYSLDPRGVKLSRPTLYLLLFACVVALFACFSVRPLWQFAWRHGLYSINALMPEKAASGSKVPGGGWHASKRILVYGMPGVPARTVDEAHRGMKGLVEELGLDIAVERVEAPPESVEALQAATKAGTDLVDYDRFCALRLDQRGTSYGEMVVFGGHFVDPTWAFGLSTFGAGVAMLTEAPAGLALGRHEGAHLIGYGKHDDFPWYIIGYKEAWYPDSRDTLMMLLPTSSDALSERARDALVNFWRGMERRDGVRYFKGEG